MGIRIGIGFGGWPFPDSDPEHLWRYVDTCEALDVDSLWLSDRIVSSRLNVEPIVALSPAPSGKGRFYAHHRSDSFTKIGPCL
jgi:hypothetical protein